MQAVNPARKAPSFREYLFLHGVFLLYSCTAVCAKLASSQPFLSRGFIGFYGLELLLFGGYALLWQRALSFFDLNVAYANRGVVLLWAMLWGATLFGERILARNMIGAALIIVGIGWLNFHE